jgi:hypothetical protein
MPRQEHVVIRSLGAPTAAEAEAIIRGDQRIMSTAASSTWTFSNSIERPEPSLHAKNSDMASFPPETFAKTCDVGAKFPLRRHGETLHTTAKPRKRRGFPNNTETHTRDGTGWLTTQSESNPSPLRNPC